jgi:type I restriction enzyme S subunit
MLKRARGVSYPAVLEKDVRNEPIPLPPLDEQRRLVALIDDLLGHIISGDRDLEAALDGIRFFERSSAALIAGRSSPPRVRLDQVGQVSVGATPRRGEASFWGGGIPWVSSSEVAFNRVASTRETITETGLGDRARRLQPAGSVLIAMYGDGKTRGRVAILDIDAATNQAVASVRIDPARAVPDFVFYCLVQQYEAIREIGSGTQQKNLSKGLVAAIEVPCPPLLEQREAVRRFEALHSKTRILREEVAFQREASARLRRALLSSAFVGQVRT